MNGKKESPQKSRELFIGVIVSRVFLRAIASVEELLRFGSDWKNPPRILSDLHSWFESLDIEERKLVLALVKYTAKSTVFDLLTYFDGLQGSSDLIDNDQISDFSIYFQKYNTQEDKYRNDFFSQERISGLRYVDYLHDLFTEAVDDKSYK